ncbi:MAG: hypothetical protein K0R52_538 [Alphaproteobacteria bacterium]|nr:hypothetical protein [Alphaproteobacteria bacterium]
MPQVSPSCPQTIQPLPQNPVSINKQTNIPPSHLHLVEKLSNPSDDIYHTEQDYIDLFSYAKKGHMAKYVHMHRPYIYENLIQQDSYYPFKMECELLAEKADQISKSLKGVTQALEIGPGSYSPIMLKTVPLLRALTCQPSFSIYKALDSNLEYAAQACRIVQEQFPTINTRAIEIDFLAENGLRKIKDGWHINGKKLLFYFGQTIFGNNNDENISRFLNKIGMMLRDDEYLLFGIDTNKNESTLEAAYNTSLTYEILLNIMYHLKNKFNLKGFNPRAFDFIYRWNAPQSIAEFYLVSLSDQILNIRDQKIIINKNQEFNILNSKKFDVEQIKTFLNLEKLTIKEIITPNDQQKNKISIVIAQKTQKNS